MENAFSERKTVVHIITSLKNAGAEGVLFQLVRNDNSHKHIVISLTDEGTYGPKLKDAGVEVITLNLTVLTFFKNLMLVLKRLNQINNVCVQSWMYHADFFASFIKVLNPHTSIYWNVRHSKLLLSKTKFSTITIALINGLLLSWAPKKIIFCGHSSLEAHRAFFFPTHKSVVIPNGVKKISTVRNDVAFRRLTKNSRDRYLGIAIGYLGRFDKQKNFPMIFDTFVSVMKLCPDSVLILAGKGINSDNQILLSYISQRGIPIQNICLLGEISDPSDFYSSIDVMISASLTEGYPNVLAEACSLGIPIVSSDVGDVKYILSKDDLCVKLEENNFVETATSFIYEKFRKNIKVPPNLKRQVYVDGRIYTIEQMASKYSDVWQK